MNGIQVQKSHIYCPPTKLWQGNVFTSVSIHGEWGVGLCMPGPIYVPSGGGRGYAWSQVPSGAGYGRYTTPGPSADI